MNSRLSQPRLRPQSTSATGLRAQLYDVIFEADTWAGKLFDILLLVAILSSVLVVTLETVEPIRAKHQHLLVTLEWTFTILFTCEYALRLMCVGNRWAYATSFYGLIDLISILPSYFSLLLMGSGSFAVVRAFRLLRVFRILRLLELSSQAEELGHAVWMARGKILVFITFVAIAVTVSGALMYEIESHGGNEAGFSSIPQGMYWAIVTMTTVGYGDVVPYTTLGKAVSALLILVGYSLIIVPTGFVSAEIMSAKQQRQIELTRTCPNCLLEGHDTTARYCRQCGELLVADSTSGTPA